MVSLRIETIHLASRDGIILSERIDYVRVSESGRTCNLPVAGAIQMREGKIAWWHDYADQKTAEQELFPSTSAS